MNRQELKEKLRTLADDISTLQNTKRETNYQLRDVAQADFEQEKGIKSGDKITTTGGHEYYYDRFIVDAFGYILVLCHPVKKDGTPSRADRHVMTRDFDFEV